MLKLKFITTRARAMIDISRNAIGWRQSDARIAGDAQKWWSKPPEKKQALYSHWRSAFDSDEAWLAIGKHSFDLYESFAMSMNFNRPAGRVIEWGCGGGANAVHFGREAEAFYGVDVAPPSLEECAKQMTCEGLNNFQPVLVEVANPEVVLQKITQPCDLFICLYVFEVFPTPEYGKRILQIAAKLLRPGGMALIQVKYPVDLATRSRGWGYRFGVASMTSYRIDDFWKMSAECGFIPHAVHLVPKQELVGDDRYAYFFLSRR